VVTKDRGIEADAAQGDGVVEILTAVRVGGGEIGKAGGESPAFSFSTNRPAVVAALEALAITVARRSTPP